jgi:hypothetical protein
MVNKWFHGDITDKYHGKEIDIMAKDWLTLLIIKLKVR